MCSIWKHTAGPPRSRAKRAVAAAEPAAGTGADQGNPGAVHTEGGGVVVEEPERGKAVVDGRGIGGFGSQPVLDRHDQRTDVRRQHGGTEVLGVDIAHHEAAAMDHEDAGHRPCRGLLGPVDADRNLGVVLPPRDRAVLDPDAELGRDLTVQSLQHGLESLAGGHRILETQVRGQQVDERRELGVDHGVFPLPRETAAIWAACGCRRRCGSTRRSCTSSRAVPRPAWRTRPAGPGGAGRARPGPACP